VSREFALKAYCLSRDNFKQGVLGSKGETYTVTPNNYLSEDHDLNCTCPQFTFRNKKCKHIKSIEEFGLYCGWHSELSEGLQEKEGVCPKCQNPTGYEKWMV
tara:strand:- start:177 stop:482 length:306 start_codon:yes stop_codon:yes gene_type:complete